MARSRLLLAMALFLSASCVNEGLPVVRSSDGVQLSYQQHGAAGPDVVLIHGWTNNQTFWDPHIPRLSQDHRVLTLDLAGFGESGVDRSEWTMERYGQDVVAVLEGLEIDHGVLVGFSMGGAAALEAAAAAPDRVSGVVLVDVFHNPMQQYDQQWVDEFVQKERDLWQDPDYVRGDLSPDAPESLVQWYIDEIPASPPEAWFAIIRSFFAWRNVDLPQTLEEVEVPIVAINGDYRKTHVETFRQFLPEFDVRIIPGVGHLGVIWMQTDLFDQYLSEYVTQFVSE